MKEQDHGREYRDDVETIAKDVALERKEGRDVGNAIHEAVDGSQWVIYTWRNLVVLQESCNCDAAWEHGDGLQGRESFSDAVQTMAFYAMRQDVEDALAELPEDDDDA